MWRTFFLLSLFLTRSVLAVPQVESVYPSLNLDDLTIIFNEPVDASAEDPAAYTLSGGGVVQKVQRLRDQTVRLITSPQTPNTTYTVQIQNVQGQSGLLAPTSRTFKALYPSQYYDSFSSDTGAGTLSVAGVNTGPAFIEEGLLKLTKDAGTATTYYILTNLNPGARVLEFAAQFKVRIYQAGITAADGFSFSFGPDQTVSLWGEEGAGNGVSVSFDVYDNGISEAPSVCVKLSSTGPLLVDSAVEYQAGYGKKFSSLDTGERFVDVMIHLNQAGNMSVYFDGQTVVTNALVPPAFFTNLANSTFAFASRCGSPAMNHWIDEWSISTVTDQPDRVQPKLIASSASAGKITLTFDKYMAKHPAEDVRNYQLTPSVPVERAILSSDWKTVTLFPKSPLCDDTTYTLSISNLTDRASTPNSITPNGTSVAFKPTAVWPAELGTQANGFQDNFTTSIRHPAWELTEGSENAFVQDEPGGLLSITSLPGTNYLALNKPYLGTETEILARVRVSKFDGFGTGPGLAMVYTPGTETTPAQALTLSFGRDPSNHSLVFRSDSTLESFALPLAWTFDDYYWFRLKMEAGNFYAKAWPANGDVVEPPDWLFIFPSEATGLVGFVSGQEETASRMEVDYVLVRSATLPSLVVDPDLCRRKPAPPLPIACDTLKVEKSGNQIILRWSGACRLQESSQAVGPFVDVPNNPTSPVILEAPKESQKFFRLKGNQ